MHRVRGEAELVFCGAAPVASGVVTGIDVISASGRPSATGASSAAWNFARSGVASVTISGLNFGAADTPSASLAVLDTCLSTSWTSATTVGCTPQSQFPGSAMRAIVTVVSTVGSGATEFSFDGLIS